MSTATYLVVRAHDLSETPTGPVNQMVCGVAEGVVVHASSGRQAAEECPFQPGPHRGDAVKIVVVCLSTFRADEGPRKFTLTRGTSPINVEEE